MIKNSKLVKYYSLGKGSILNIESIIKKNLPVGKEAIYLIDDFFKKNFSLIKNKINFEYKENIFFIDTSHEPTTEYIDKIADKIFSQSEVGLVIGIGGGSTLDITKALSILATNAGPVEKYQGWDLVENEPIYKIGIPTISGTGAEFTRTAVMTSPTKKLGINSDFSVFDQVILEPSFLESVPTDKFIYTAMDCFVHNVESLRGTQNDSMTIAFAEKSLQMLNDIFLKEMDHEKLMVSSALGGIAVANSNVGICHPLSYGLSLVLGLRHGFAICIAFNQLLEYYPEVESFKKILEKYKIVLPKIIDENVSSNQINKMAEATLLNEKPLENAFGKNWRKIFNKEKVVELIKKM